MVFVRPACRNKACFAAGLNLDILRHSKHASPGRVDNKAWLVSANTKGRATIMTPAQMAPQTSLLMSGPRTCEISAHHCGGDLTGAPPRIYWRSLRWAASSQ